MSIENIRTRMISSIWQAMAQSGVDLSLIPQDQQEILVSKVADSVMVTMDALLEEEAAMTLEPESDDPKAEKELWKGRPFLSLVETYAITSERIKIIKGLLARDVENFELIRIQDIDLKQGVSERIFGIGDITVRGHDPSNPLMVLRNIAKPEEVYEILRRAWLDARKRYGLQFREYM